MRAFEEINEQLVSIPILIAPNWGEPFEIMCNASDFAIGSLLRQRRENILKAIYYTSKTLSKA